MSNPTWMILTTVFVSLNLILDSADLADVVCHRAVAWYPHFSLDSEDGKRTFFRARVVSLRGRHSRCPL